MIKHNCIQIIRYLHTVLFNNDVSLNEKRLTQDDNIHLALLRRAKKSFNTVNNSIYFSLPGSILYMQGVSGGIVNILGGGSMDYSEYISSYKHVSNFQLVWRYSCLNVTHKKLYKRYEWKTNDLLIAFIGYVNDLNKLKYFRVSVKKSHHRIQCTFQLSWQQYV